MRAFLIALFCLLAAACQNPLKQVGATSTMLPPGGGQVDVIVAPLTGAMGDEAAQRFASELTRNRILTAGPADVRGLVSVETDLHPASPNRPASLARLGAELGADYVILGTVSTETAAPYAYPRVSMTVELIDTETGEPRWIGRYGEKLWTSALSTDADLTRSAKHLTKEFIRSGGAALVRGAE